MVCIVEHCHIWMNWSAFWSSSDTPLLWFSGIHVIHCDNAHNRKAEKELCKIPRVLTQKCYPLFKGWSHCVKYSSVKLSLGCGSSGLHSWPVWHVQTFYYFICSTTSTTCTSMQGCQETTHKMPKMAKIPLTSHRCTPFNSVLHCFSLYYFRLADVKTLPLERRCKSVSIHHQSCPKWPLSKDSEKAPNWQFQSIPDPLDWNFGNNPVLHMTTE
jgi:hypothetical protein